jgi:hypothetical protein
MQLEGCGERKIGMIRCPKIASASDESASSAFAALGQASASAINTADIVRENLGMERSP